MESSDSHPVWARCSSSTAERTDCGNPSHSRAVLHVQKSSWSRFPLDSVCTQSVRGAMCGPWRSPPKKIIDKKQITKARLENIYLCYRQKITLTEPSHLSHNRLTAGSANSFSDCLHAQFVEVRLQAAKHVVQLVDLCRGSTGDTTLPLGHNLKWFSMKIVIYC